MSARRAQRMAATLLAAVLVTGLAGCSVFGPSQDDVVDPSRVILSNPASPITALAGTAARAAPSSPLSDIVYVSLVPGTVEEGRLARITNERSGATLTAAMADGGFDPVPLAALVGDTIGLRIEAEGGATTYLRSYVPPERDPMIVRTDPPRGKRDVVLNAPIRIVFSEPMDPSTITGTSVWLDKAGTPVAGRVVLAPGGLGAEFLPDVPLAGNTEYVLTVTRSVFDLDGAPLSQAIDVRFRTGTTGAVAMIHTNPAALFGVDVVGMGRLLRNTEYDAVLDDAGRFTGAFRIYYPETGRTASGSITCFGLSGDTAWIAGRVDASSEEGFLNADIVWRAIDRGSLDSGVADQLTMAWVGDNLTRYGTALDYCDGRPSQVYNTTDEAWEPAVFRDIEAGDLVAGGSTPVLPPPSAAAHLAFATAFRTPMAGRNFGFGVRVRALDESRSRTADFNGIVEVALGVNPVGAVLAGTTTVTAQNGVALFDDLAISAPGIGYTLIATSPGLSGSTSAPFEVAELRTGTIAFHDSAGIHLVQADGSGRRTLVDDPADGPFSHTQPRWSPDGTRIAFRSSRGGNWDIYVMAVDGSTVTRLTRESALDDSPGWSPDGRQIAFTSERDGWSDIYVMDVDGTNVRRLTDDPAWDINSAFSPDGSRIAFASDRHDPGGDLEIYVMNADGSGITRLTHDPDMNDFPRWSPDGTRITYHGSGVYVMNADGSGVVQLRPGGGAPAWSPNGRAIVYSAGDLFLMNPDGSGVVDLGLEGYEPDWSWVSFQPLASSSARTLNHSR